MIHGGSRNLADTLSVNATRERVDAQESCSERRCLIYEMTRLIRFGSTRQRPKFPARAPGRRVGRLI